jgi:hypothetical protein
MLRNNQISLIVLLFIIGVTLYLINCDNTGSPIKNAGELEIDNSLGTNSPPENQLNVDPKLLDEIMEHGEEERYALSEEETHQEETHQEEGLYAHSDEEARTKKHKAKSLDKYFDNCAINGGSLYNKNDFIPIEESDNGAASIQTAFNPPIAKGTCTDCVYMNDSKDKKWVSKDFLPNEKKDWFETDFSNTKAEFNINDDKLINTQKFIGINTVGQSLKNPSYDIRGTVACPKINVGPWNNSTIEPDYNIKGL